MSGIARIPAIAVVGAGPAGSAAVLQLARLGIKPILIDKSEFPRDKVCGDGIPAKVIQLGAQLGLNQDELNRMGFPIFGMELYGPHGQRVHFGGKSVKGAAKSFCIPRKVFDHYLFEKAAAQTKDVLLPYKAIRLTRSGQKWKVLLKHAKTGAQRLLTVDILIAADGATSLLARKVLNLKTNAIHRYWGLRQYFRGGPFENKVHIIYDKRLLPGYLWAFPVGENRINIGLMAEQFSIDEKKALPLQALFDQILHDNPQIRRILANAKAEERYFGAPLPLGSAPGRRVADGFLAIGDAAAFINPITGGGIYSAMQSGMVAAEVVAQACRNGDWSVAQLRPYEQWWRHHLLPGFKAADRLRRFLRSEKRTDYLFNRMEKQGFVAKLFIRIYGQPLPRFFYFNPKFWLGILLAEIA